MTDHPQKLFVPPLSWANNPFLGLMWTFAGAFVSFIICCANRPNTATLLLLAAVVSLFAFGFLRRRSRDTRFVTPCLAVGAILLWAAFQIIGPYTSLHNRAHFIVGYPRLQQWATDLLDHPPPRLDNRNRIPREDLPPDIRKLSWDNIYYSKGDRDRGIEGQITFYCGGGFYHWGLVVGRPDFVIHDYENSDTTYEHLSGGIWGYYEN